ncbi:unnamed protein product [Prorocentrum cordatum]|uniref:Uncharacterized protein n=1 Tax=Prorocentrum cordatum TaxID=2364126 RepID=A0ABN9PSY6_9DINO|nr:unnamed protein product [Polarella glacialis]
MKAKDATASEALGDHQMASTTRNMNNEKVIDPNAGRSITYRLGPPNSERSTSRPETQKKAAKLRKQAKQSQGNFRLGCCKWWHLAANNVGFPPMMLLMLIR